MAAGNNNNLDSLAFYLTESGIDEGELNHILHEKITIIVSGAEMSFKKSIMDLVAEKEWDTIWEIADKYISGEALVVLV